MDLTLQVGKYEVQKHLGKGATGTVYLAKDTFTGKEVALKTIEPEVFRDPEFGTVYRSQFLNEASLAGKLRHPHIVSILDAVVSEDSGHIAMELVMGGDLSKHVVSGKLLPIADVLQIGFKCCGALEYAATQGIVHRDIKPANIMIAEGTEVKIADFGAAFLKKSQVVQTAAMGSPYYMSPEQIQGKEVSFHSDMYSLGVVLFELLTGGRPFGAENIEALMQKIIQQDPAPPSSLRADLPKQLDSLVLRALKKDPKQRYATWAEFALEITKIGPLVLPAGAIPDSEKYVMLKSVPMLSTLADSELWELARAGRWTRMEKGKKIVKEKDKGTSFFFLAKGEAKVTKGPRLLNMVSGTEFFGEMAWIAGGEARHATVESHTDVLLAEFEPVALDRMSLGAQLQLTRALVRNVADRLELANTRLSR
ncbi:MAG: eukaryotic-like serine/threonine-protein kinase [Betaproteobacteria bacterium]|jgi:serine/threonine protein kinase|nr:eukaryotic-like serine/threonine-protein kinase [Betaproteobacteria bacterium]